MDPNRPVGHHDCQVNDTVLASFVNLAGFAGFISHVSCASLLSFEVLIIHVGYVYDSLVKSVFAENATWMICLLQSSSAMGVPNEKVKSVTLETSQVLKGWLKLAAALNTLSKFVVDAVFHVSRG